MTIDLKKLFGDLSAYDTKTTNALLKALKDNFKKEFDYLRFKQSVVNMQDMGLDEVTSIKSAYVTASTMGLTKASLIKTATHYQTVLEKEKRNFASALKEQMKSKIEGKRAEAVELQKRIKQYEEKILAMQKEMKLYQKKIDSVEHEVEKATAKIEVAKEKFVTALNGISGVIQSDIDQIETSL